MKFRHIIKRDLFFFRRSNGATLLLAAVCCAILTGALLVGDSVQYSLKRLAQMRLGQKTQYAMPTGDRFFRQELASEIAKDSKATVAPVLAVKGILEAPDGSTRVNNINVYGVNKQFWQLASNSGQVIPFELTRPIDGLLLYDISISESLQSRLADIEGDFLLRIQKPTALSRDLIFSTENADSQAWPIKIAGITPDDVMGRFSLQTLQEPPLNIFVPIDWLAEKIAQPDMANLLLAGDAGSLSEMEARLKQSATLTDYGLELRHIESQNVFELRSPRIFLDAAIGKTAKQTGTGAAAVLTYFVNEIRSGKKTTPYSMVAGLDASSGLVLGDDEIAINEWLANDLNIDEGAAIELTYFQVTPTRKLVEQTHTFTVTRVVPMMGAVC